MMETKVEPITWGNFRERLLEKYFPDSARFAKEAEFLRLEQGGMSVNVYTARFEYLARFYTQAISEDWKCRKFEEGLRHGLKKGVAPLCIRKFPVLIEKVKMIENMEKDDSRVMRSHGGGSASGGLGHSCRSPMTGLHIPELGLLHSSNTNSLGLSNNNFGGPGVIHARRRGTCAEIVLTEQ